MFKVVRSLTVRDLGSRSEVSPPERAQELAQTEQKAENDDEEAASAKAVLPIAQFEDVTLSLEEQLPYLRIGQEDAIADEYSPPNLQLAIQPTLTHFRTAFVEVREFNITLPCDQGS